MFNEKGLLRVADNTLQLLEIAMLTQKSHVRNAKRVEILESAMTINVYWHWHR